MAERPDADPTTVVADADVLAADCLCGGPAREALDLVRSHSWITLAASDCVLADARAVIADLADDDLAADWRELAERDRRRVDHDPDDHPGIGSAAAAGAAHLLTLDEAAVGPAANLAVQPHLRLSMRTPAAFVASFDAAALYEATHNGDYPGPDRDPRG